MNTTDATLLGLFARERDEAAFAELARRYGNLIFHTALRRTGSHAMAQEVSQQVLCVIARKAANLALTTGEGGLAPWVHRATLFEASKAIRSETSQQRRKQLQHPDDMPATAPGESFWDDTLPHLDPAMDKLGESDREVLIQHFFRRLTFREIAATTGRSADAVQKQSVRALEKLSHLLRSRGVVLPAAALAAGLMAESAKAAPPVLISSLATEAVATTATLPANPLLVMLSTKTKILVPLVVLVCALPVISQQITLSRANSRLADLQALSGISTDPLASLATASTRQRAARPAASKTASPLISDKRDWMTLMEESNNRGNTPTALAAFRAKLDAMSVAERARVMREAAQSDVSQMQKCMFLSSITSSLLETDPGIACATIVDSFKGDPSFGFMFNNALGYPAYRAWLKQDPAAVQAWYENLKREHDEGGWAPAKLVNDFQVPLFGTLVRVNPDAARAMLAAETSDESRQFLLRCGAVAYAGNGGTEGEGSAAEAATYLQYAREYPGRPEDGPPEFNDIISRLAMNGRVNDLQAWASLPNLTPEERQILGSEVAANWARYPDKAPALEAWLKKTMPQDADRLIQQARDAHK